MKAFFYITVFIFALFFSKDLYSQEKMNRWSADINIGVSRIGNQIQMDNYYTSSWSFPHIEMGVRYMVKPVYGFKLDFGYLSFKNGSSSLDVKGHYISTNLQGLVNLVHLFDMRDVKKFGFLVHGGVGYSFMRLKEPNNSGHRYDVYIGADRDRMLNLLIGGTVMYKLSEKVALTGDFTFIKHTTDALKLNGYYIKDDYLGSSIINISVGATYTFGKNKNIDWKDSKTQALNWEEDKLEDISKSEEILPITASETANAYLNESDNSLN